MGRELLHAEHNCFAQHRPGDHRRRAAFDHGRHGRRPGRQEWEIMAMTKMRMLLIGATGVAMATVVLTDARSRWERAMDMSPQDVVEHADRLYTAAQEVLGKDGWDLDRQWFSCGLQDDVALVQLSVSSRLAADLPGRPADLVDRVKGKWGNLRSSCRDGRRHDARPCPLHPVRPAVPRRGQSRRLALRSVDRNGHREFQLRQPLRPRGHLRTAAADVLLAGTDRHPAFDALIV